MIAEHSRVKIDVTTNLACDLQKGDKVSCVSVEHTRYSEYLYPIKEIRGDQLKTYNFYFLGGILTCDVNQTVLCAYKKILPIGEALQHKIRIHTASGLILPHQIENCRQPTEVLDISVVGRDSRAAIIESVYCI